MAAPVLHSFSGTFSLPISTALYAGQTGSMSLNLPTPTVICTVPNITPAANSIQTATCTGILNVADPLPSLNNILATFYIPSSGTATTGYLPFTATVSSITLGMPVLASPVSTTSLTISSSASVTASTLTNGTSHSNNGLSDNTASASVSAPSPSQSSTVSNQTMYGAGVLAGAVVGCAIGAAILTAIGVFLCLRRRKKGLRDASKDSDKELPLLPGHGKAVYVTKNGGAWEKHLPQADADSTIRSMTSSTIDQIALHVENFYASRSNAVLHTEHQFELETIDTSHLGEPITTTLLRSSHTENLIKHYISSYIISMINFEDSTAKGSFLPRTFRKQWQPPSQNDKGISLVPNLLVSTKVSTALTQAHSQWRVLTAYLRQEGDDEQTYLTERNAVIETAAGHVCKAFEPWANVDYNLRFQNLVGIMKRASELGIQLFSQPGRFEWQWQASKTASAVGTVGSRDTLVILPGLYKTTDQNAVPLTPPLRLVEPVVASI